MSQPRRGGSRRAASTCTGSGRWRGRGSVGPARTTISAVADRAGVQRATVYRHFPDEQALPRTAPLTPRNSASATGSSSTWTACRGSAPNTASSIRYSAEPARVAYRVSDIGASGPRCKRGGTEPDRLGTHAGFEHTGDRARALPIRPKYPTRTLVPSVLLELGQSPRRRPLHS